MTTITALPAGQALATAHVTVHAQLKAAAEALDASVAITATADAPSLVVHGLDAATDAIVRVTGPSDPVVPGGVRLFEIQPWGGVYTYGTGDFEVYGYSSSFPPSFYLNRYRGDQNAPAAVHAGDLLGNLSFQGYDGSGDQLGARIGVVVDGTPGTNDMPGAIIFSTTPDGSATVAERVRIDSTGRVILGGAAGPSVITGTGSPQSAVTAPVGSLYLRTDGGAGSTLYVKESGTGNTGWAAK